MEQMIQVTIKHGLTREVTREFAEGTTVRQIISDPNNRAILGYGDNVAAVRDGVTLASDEVVEDGDVIVLEKQAASKA